LAFLSRNVAKLETTAKGKQLSAIRVSYEAKERSQGIDMSPSLTELYHAKSPSVDLILSP